MSLRKTVDIKNAHAVYEHGGWTWAVLKVNAPSRGPKHPYATWYCAVQSPMTFGGYDRGDTYASDVMSNGRLKMCSLEFMEYLRK